MKITTIIKTTDSMNTIQEKLKRGGNIIFTTGVYKITKQLKLYKNSVINCAGSTLRRCGNFQSIFLNNCTNKTTKYKGDGNIVITNGTFEGMGGYSYDNTITFFHSHDIRIENCTFLDTLYHAIEINSSKNVEIKNCKFLGYNLESKDYTYRELIQIDYAGAGAFFLAGSSATSACYDGTMCKGIKILNNTFDKSSYRDYPYACIGTHSQLYQGSQHKDICIKENHFRTKRDNTEQPCISIIGMDKVEVKDNVFDCDVVARIYSKTKSYTKSGTSVSAADNDGYCSNVSIMYNNFVNTVDNCIIQKCKTKKKFKKIVVKDNKLIKEVLT